MGIIGFLALVGMLLPTTTTALAEVRPRLNISDYFTQERYIEGIISPSLNANASETTGDDAFLSSSAPLTSKGASSISGVAGVRRVLVTAYSSTPDQTDSTPFTMANGKHVYDGAVAANFLPFGTLVRFPDSFGNKIFTVEDRMHERFSDRMDIWMPTRQEAINFGVRVITVEIIR